MPTHAIKSRVGKLKTRVGKLKKIFGASRRIFSKNFCPPWPETVPAPLIVRTNCRSGAQVPVAVAAEVRPDDSTESLTTMLGRGANLSDKADRCRRLGEESQHTAEAIVGRDDVSAAASNGTEHPAWLNKSVENTAAVAECMVRFFRCKPL